jgi:uncharacterized membrane protein
MPTVHAVRAPLVPVRLRSWRERLRSSLWVTPALMVVLALLVQDAALDLDVELARDPTGGWLTGADASVADSAASTIAAAMLTFLGVVFSLSILALQLTSGQFSPRVMRTFVRARTTKLALGTFMATFAYALMTLVSIEGSDDGTDDFVPLLTLLLLLLLVMGSLFVFLAFVRTIVRLIRVSYVIDVICRETSREITRLARSARVEVPRAELGEPSALLRHQGRPGVLGAVDVRRLARLAARHDAVLALQVRVGDFLASGTPTVAVHGPRPVPAAAIRRCLLTNVERSMTADPAFGLRQLADIAARALSPAVNDPTTAVQVIDRVTHLLALMGAAPDPPEAVLGSGGDRGGSGVVRVVLLPRTWGDEVVLGFTELRRYGHDAPQVTRRLFSALHELRTSLPADRAAALAAEEVRLRADVDRTVADPAERDLYLLPDRAGLG